LNNNNIKKRKVLLLLMSFPEYFKFNYELDTFQNEDPKV
jgi:hypothetical protein